MFSHFQIFKPYADRLEHGLVQGISAVPGAVTAEQMHGDEIMVISELPDEEPKCDGFITNNVGLPLMIKVADCQGVLMYDPVTHSAAALHSGWRGSTLNILGKAVQKMRQEFGSQPADLRVAVSPSLGPCCAEFSDPRNELPAFCHRFILEGNRVDFWTLSLAQLQEEGVPKDQIELAGICSKCTPGYLSHRKGDKGRMGVWMGLRNKD